MRRRSGILRSILALCGLTLIAAACVQVQTLGFRSPAFSSRSFAARQQPESRQISTSTPPPVPARDLLTRYCVTCHNAQTKTAGLLLGALDVDNVGADAERWEKVAIKLRTREMPPPGRPRPDRATYDAMAGRLEDSLDAAAAAH